MNKKYVSILFSTFILLQTSSYAGEYKKYPCKNPPSNELCANRIKAPPIVHSNNEDKNNEIRITVIPYKINRNVKDQ